MMNVNVVDMVKVKQGLARQVRDVVKNERFYNQSRDDQFDRLNDLKDAFLEIYGIEDEGLMVVDIAEYGEEESIEYGKFDEEENVIIINRMSIITFLNCMRQYLYSTGVGCQLNVKAVDSVAWACRIFKLACPKSFEKSVRANKVVNFIWDEENNTSMMVLPGIIADAL